MRKRVLLAWTVLVAALWSASAQAEVLTVNGSYMYNDTRDFLCVYYGADGRKKWTEEQIKAGVVHTYSDGHTDWFYPGFLYLEFRHNGRGFIYSTTTLKPALREDWEWLIGRLLERGMGLDALNSCIAHQKQLLGPPPFRHKIMVVVPVPTSMNVEWGYIGRRKITFPNPADRIAAVKWYIDTFLEEYKKQGYTEFDLDGFYWVEESMQECGNIAAACADYIHSKGYKLYWSPYLNEKNSQDWRRYGFDGAYIQPNYSLYVDKDVAMVEKACTKARTNSLGLVIEFNQKYFKNREGYGRTFDTLLDELDRFGALRNASFTYYLDNSALLQLNESTVPEDKERLDRIARIVESHRAPTQQSSSRRATRRSGQTQQQPMQQRPTTPDYPPKGVNQPGRLNPDDWRF